MMFHSKAKCYYFRGNQHILKECSVNGKMIPAFDLQECKCRNDLQESRKEMNYLFESSFLFVNHVNQRSKIVNTSFNNFKMFSKRTKTVGIKNWFNVTSAKEYKNSTSEFNGLLRERGKYVDYKTTINYHENQYKDVIKQCLNRINIAYVVFKKYTYLYTYFEVLILS